MTHAVIPDTPAQFGEEELRQAMELLFFAYRDFTDGPDKLLADFGFGRAHHRVLYFVGRHEGITVTELLAILRITKQSLNRVLGQLMAEGFIDQTPDADDRRRRRHALTSKGRDLERRLTEGQMAHILSAYREAGPETIAGFRAVLRALVAPADRDRFADTPSL